MFEEPLEDALRASRDQVTQIMAALAQVVAEGRARGWPDVSIDFEKRGDDYERVREAIDQLGGKINGVLFEQADHRQDPALAHACGMTLHRLRGLLDRLHTRWRFQDDTEAPGPPPPPLGVTPKELAALQGIREALTREIVRMVEAEVIEGQGPTTGGSPQPPVVAAETTDHEHTPVVAQLRSEGAWVQAALVAYLLPRESATFDEVKRYVHDDPTVSDAAVRKRVSEANRSLTTIGSPLRLSTSSRRVYLSIPRHEGRVIPPP
jgi:hypothetical protein